MQIGLFEVLFRNKTLRALGLSHNQITEDGFKYLIGVLEKNSSLELMNLAANKIENGMVSETEDLHDVPEDKLEMMRSFRELELRLQVAPVAGLLASSLACVCGVSYRGERTPWPLSGLSDRGREIFVHDLPACADSDHALCCSKTTR